MDLTSDVLNITKIKDGFFLGDEATAANLDVIIQFKITHMINAAGSQIINAWESIGLKYLTLNWSENSNQNLFDQKDEIANRIVNFIDDSFKNGEGILVHSLRGQNRACLVIIIYLIKKYRWTMSKSLEFLNNKKFDVEIPKYFLNQLSLFESRLSKIGQGPKSNSWNDYGNENDLDEVVVRNTYVNGLPRETGKFSNYGMIDAKSLNSRRICWADNNYNNKNLSSTNLSKELIYQKDIKPVLSHKKLKPTKSCLKSKSQTSEIKKSSSQVFSSTTISSNIRESSTTKESIMDLSMPNNPFNSSILNNDNKATSDNLNDNYNIGLSSSNDILKKNYTNAGNIYSNINNNINNTEKGDNSVYNKMNNYNLSKSHNFEANAKDKEIINPSTNFSHIQIGGPMSMNSNNLSNSNNYSVNQFKPKTVNSNNVSNNSSNPYSNNIQPVTRQNNFTVNSNSMQQRSLSVGQDSNKQIPNSYNQNQAEPKIIIASQYKNVIHNNYNNIFIQSPDDLQKLYNNNPDNYESSFKNDRTTSNNQQNKKELNPLLNSNYNQNTNHPNLNPQLGYPSGLQKMKEKENDFNSNSSNLNLPLQTGKLIKNDESQKMMKNNYFTGENKMGMSMNSANIGNSATLERKMKVIDYTTSTAQGNNIIKNNQGYNYHQSNNQNKSNINTPLIKPGYAINNYQPELNKKNNFNSNVGSQNFGLLNRPNSQSTKQGPIKIQNEYEKKPSTPDNIRDNNNISIVKVNNSNNNMNLKGNYSNLSNPPYATIKRSNSNKQRNDVNNERPSTAPQKENENQKMTYGQQTMKRLPSPNLKSGGNSSMGSSQKNMNVNITKYRSPSPATMNKTSTINMGSLKTMSGSKTKWK